ncbi:MAG: hypothetical protein ACREPR_15295 [Brasilonema sp.]
MSAVDATNTLQRQNRVLHGSVLQRATFRKAQGACRRRLQGGFKVDPKGFTALGTLYSELLFG